MADRLTGNEVFVRAMRLGGLSAAAREMGMSPAMAAKHLKALEARLGVTLVNRTTRRLSLTEAGSAYLERMDRVLDDLGEAEAEARAQSVNVEGLLRVSAPSAFGVAHLGRLVEQFHRLHPKLTIELGLSDRYVDLLEERWDVAIRIGRLSGSSLVARKLSDVAMCVCASPEYLEERGTPLSPSGLSGHDCLIYTLGSGAGGDWHFGRDGQQRVVVKDSLLSDNGALLAQAALAGQGIVYGPRFLVAQELRDGRLVEIDLKVDLLDMGAIYAVTPPGRRPAAKTRAWIDFLAQNLRAISGDW